MEGVSIWGGLGCGSGVSWLLYVMLWGFFGHSLQFVRCICLIACVVCIWVSVGHDIHCKSGLPGLIFQHSVVATYKCVRVSGVGDIHGYAAVGDIYGLAL